MIWYKQSGESALLLRAIDGKTDVFGCRVRNINTPACTYTCVVIQSDDSGGKDDTPLTLAIDSLQLDVVQLLTIHGASLSFVDTSGETALFRAIVKKDIPLIKDLIVNGASINHKNIAGETPLFAAIRACCLKKLFRYLLDQGADVNVVSSQGFTPLSAAFEILRRNWREQVLPAGEIFHHSSIHAIIRVLVPMTENLNDTNGLEPAETCFGLCLRSDVRNYYHVDMPATVLMLKHGACLPYDVMFWIAFHQRETLPFWAKDDECGFFTDTFSRFLLLSGVKIEKTDALRRKLPVVNRQKYDPFLDALSDVICEPLTLQQWSVIAVRDAISMGGRLWVKLDTLPVPKVIKNVLKMKSVDYREYKSL